VNTASNPHSSLRAAPSLIKWTGSKRLLAARIAGLIPDHDRYFEPFLGSGALLYALARPSSVAGDLYAPLVEIFRAVQSDPAGVASHYERQWRLLQASRPDHFYKVRERFNRHRDPLDLCFLMRTCVNGIARFNVAGEFNNSFHLSRRGMTPDRFRSIAVAWSERLAGVRFLCQDYEATLEEARRGDFVYLDPPYAGSRQRYIADLDFQRLLGALGALNRRGVRWALSFDGRRGAADLRAPIPRELYHRRLSLAGGSSPVGKVLGGREEPVTESLYLNYAHPPKMRPRV
jgi:DNA adenine methylase